MPFADYSGPERHASHAGTDVKTGEPMTRLAQDDPPFASLAFKIQWIPAPAAEADYFACIPAL